MTRNSALAATTGNLRNACFFFGIDGSHFCIFISATFAGDSHRRPDRSFCWSFCNASTFGDIHPKHSHSHEIAFRECSAEPASRESLGTSQDFSKSLLMAGQYCVHIRSQSVVSKYPLAP